MKIKKISKPKVKAHLEKQVSKAKAVLDKEFTRVSGNFPSTSKAGQKERIVSRCQNCTDLDVLVGQLKEKCSMTKSKREQVQLLTIVPASWTIEQVSKEFNVSKYLVKKSRELKKSKGVLFMTETKKGKTLSRETEKAVIDFYQRDDISRVCPGKKDCVSFRNDEGKKVCEQKRLLLANLNEIYSTFKKETSIKIGFSKFCQLGPKFCVTVGSSGSHSVCVCTIHQNTKLQMSALEELQKFHYLDLISKIVCDISSRDCMHRCEQCPEKEGLKSFLEELVEIDTNEAVIPNEPITFKQWVTTDRLTLVTQEEPLSDLLINFARKLIILHPIISLPNPKVIT